ncbi:MAG: hypothetical protein ACRDZ8_08140 [Acidimicrobiales bacterium]
MAAPGAEGRAAVEAVALGAVPAALEAQVAAEAPAGVGPAAWRERNIARVVRPVALDQAGQCIPRRAASPIATRRAVGPRGAAAREVAWVGAAIGPSRSA